MAKKDLKEERIVYKPFEYPEAFDYWLKQQQAHWINRNRKKHNWFYLKRLCPNRNSSK